MYGEDMSADFGTCAVWGKYIAILRNYCLIPFYLLCVALSQTVRSQDLGNYLVSISDHDGGMTARSNNNTQSNTLPCTCC